MKRVIALVLSIAMVFVLTINVFADGKGVNVANTPIWESNTPSDVWFDGTKLVLNNYTYSGEVKDANNVYTGINDKGNSINIELIGDSSITIERPDGSGDGLSIIFLKLINETNISGNGSLTFICNDSYYSHFYLSDNIITGTNLIFEIKNSISDIVSITNFDSTTESRYFKITSSVPVHTHTPNSAVVENYVSATCTTDGSYDEVVYCGTCGAEISRTDSIISSTGHAFVTKTDTDYHWSECTGCGTVVSKTNHSITTYTSVSATCESAGHNEYEECAVCGYTTYQEIAMLGHDLRLTASDSDYHYSKCTRCGTCTDENLHGFITGTDANCHWLYCNACGYQLTHYNHVYDNSSDTTCNDCGYVRTIQTSNSSSGSSSSYRSSSGGSSGGSRSIGKKMRTIDVSSDSQLGRIYTNITAAQSGANVSLNVEPISGYLVESVMIISDDACFEAQPMSDGSYSFIMPDGNIKIEPIYKLIEQPKQEVIEEVVVEEPEIEETKQEPEVILEGPKEEVTPRQESFFVRLGNIFKNLFKNERRLS